MKKLLSLALALALCLGLMAIPARAAMPAKVKLIPGESRTVTTDSGGTSYRWSCSDPSVVDCRGGGTSCRLTALKPGAAVVTVYYTLQKPDLVWNPVAKAYQHTYTPYEEHDSCTVIVTDPNTGAAPSLTITPSVSYGTVGQDVSGIITDIKGFNQGLVPVEYNGLWGFADAGMRLVIPFQFFSYGASDDTMFSDSGYAPVSLKDGRKYVINTSGEAVYADTKDAQIWTNGGCIKVRRYYNQNTWEWEYYNFSGEEIAKSQAAALEKELLRRQQDWGDLIYSGNDGSSLYDTGESFLFGPPTGDGSRAQATLRIPHNGRAFYGSGAYGQINSSSTSNLVQEGLLVLFDPGTQRYGAVDTSGKTVIPFRYEKLYNSRGGYLAYQMGSEFGLLENPVNPPAAAPVPAAASPGGGGVYAKSGYGEGRMGDVMHTSSYSYTVVDAFVCSKRPEYTPAVGNELLVVEVSVKNARASLISMDDSFGIQWGGKWDNTGDYSWPISSQLPLTAADADFLLPAKYDLGANEERFGILIYEVPAGNRVFSITHHELKEGVRTGNTFVVFFTAGKA